MATAMDDRDHDDAVAFDLIENSERKTPHPCSLGVAIDDGVALRHLRNRGESRQHLIEKLLS
jgi:hypothetical protein